MKTFQLVLPPTAPGTQSPHFFTSDPTKLDRAPVGSVIVVQEMTQEAFDAIPATPESTAFFA